MTFMRTRALFTFVSQSSTLLSLDTLMYDCVLSVCDLIRCDGTCTYSVRYKSNNQWCNKRINNRCWHGCQLYCWCQCLSTSKLQMEKQPW